MSILHIGSRNISIGRYYCPPQSPARAPKHLFRRWAQQVVAVVVAAAAAAAADVDVVVVVVVVVVVALLQVQQYLVEAVVV